MPVETRKQADIKAEANTEAAVSNESVAHARTAAEEVRKAGAGVAQIVPKSDEVVAPTNPKAAAVVDDNQQDEDDAGKYVVATTTYPSDYYNGLRLR